MTVECARVGGINLAQGVCDTPVPEAVRRAAQQAIEAGENVYSRSEGCDELRAALAEKMRRHNGLDYSPDEVVVTNGATGSLYVAAMGLLDPGDEVVLFEPYYGYHLNTLEALDLGAILVPTRPPDWELDFDELETALTPRTRGIVINTPSNPTGKVFSRAELAALAELAERRDLIVFTDEVYEHFVFDGLDHVSPASLPGLRERTVTMSALSKTFAITGWRLGWIAADARWTQTFAALNDLVYVCAPTPLQQGCARALALLDEDYYRGIGPEYQAKRDQLCRALERAGLTPFVPQGSYFALADLSRLPGETGMERAMHLLRVTGVACVPGEAFSERPEAHALGRFCFGKTPADLDEACRSLAGLD
ncbi:MAG: pyridoxal phosphate-dependent aminotransferase [Proteobacteria bacterium]|nr:pyridoxal phosphate-dependent aminotransferase [Pseudomonadota bacterium]